MISTKKYLFILLGFLIAIMYLNSASVLAEDRQNRTSDSYYVEEVSYRYIDEDTEEVFKEEKRDIFRKAGLSYTATLAEDWEHASRNNGLIEERIEGEQGKTYMLDLEHPNNILKIESLSENSEENVIQVYYKAYHLTGYYTTYATVTYIDEDTDEIIETKEMEVQCHSHFSYDIPFLVEDSRGVSYRYDSKNSKNEEIVSCTKENAFRNQIKLYYKKGKLGENEAVVSVYNEFLNENYYRKIFIEGLTVGADFYINYDSESIPSNNSSAYYYVWDLETEVVYIESLSRNLAENIIRMSNVKFPPGSEATEEVVKIEFIDADTGKAFRTARKRLDPGNQINYTAPNKLTADNGNVYYFDKDNKNNHLSIKVSKIEEGSDVYKAGNVIQAYYFTKKNPGDPAAVRISYMDSATGKLVRQADKDGLIVGESYLHQPEESFKIGDVTYTYDKENTKNILQIANLSGHPGKDEIVIYYKASAPDSNQNSDHDSKPNPPKVKKLAAPKKLQAVRTGTTKAKITFRKVKKADGYQISYADNKKFRKAKKLSTGKTTVILKKLKKNRKYYVRVRAYRKVNGVKKYGTYGKVQAIAKRPRS